MPGPHITVCVCTFKRSELLLRLLEALDAQQTGDLFTHSVVVADNDRERSAETLVRDFTASAKTPVVYCAEPEQNIALARNRALSHAEGEFAAFIDDDEVPRPDWLQQLHGALGRLHADGVLGPVNPYFEGTPPQWVTKGRFFERPVHPSGMELAWHQCRTGNVLFARRILDGIGLPFDPQFGAGGEDTDFFRRMSEKGCRFVWSAEAAVLELVPPFRCTRSFLLKRALLRGSSFPKQSGPRLRPLLNSLIAVPAYAVALPVLALFGEHQFLKYFVKMSEHLSRLLATAGWVLVKERET